MATTITVLYEAIEGRPVFGDVPNVTDAAPVVAGGELVDAVRASGTPRP